MDANISRYVNLARKIKMRSEAGKINWSPASFVSTYEAPMGAEGLVAIQMVNPQPGTVNGQSTYNLAFKNERGETFYNLRDKENNNIPDLRFVLESIYNSAKSMYNRSGSGQALSSMETFIDNI